VDSDGLLPLFHFKRLHINDPDDVQAMVSGDSIAVAAWALPAEPAVRTSP
jgi:hypothetical protein